MSTSENATRAKFAEFTFRDCMKSSWRSPDGGSSVTPNTKIEPSEAVFCAWWSTASTPIRSFHTVSTGSSVNKGSLLQVVAERELQLRVRLLVHLEGERAGLFCYLFPLVVVAALTVGLHPHPVHPIEARRGSSGYGQC